MIHVVVIVVVEKTFFENRMTVQLKVIFKESLQHCVSAKVGTTPCFFAKAELLFAKTREGCLASCEIAPFGKRSQEAILPLSLNETGRRR